MSMVSDDSTSRVMVLPVSCPHARGPDITQAACHRRVIRSEAGYERRNRCTRSTPGDTADPHSMSTTSIPCRSGSARRRRRGKRSRIPRGAQATPSASNASARRTAYITRPATTHRLDEDLHLATCPGPFSCRTGASATSRRARAPCRGGPLQLKSKRGAKRKKEILISFEAGGQKRPALTEHVFLPFTVSAQVASRAWGASS